MNLLAGAAAGREASVIAVMALTSDLRSIRARGRSSGRKGTGLCTVIRSPPPRRMTHSRRVWHYVIFGRRKLAPELAPDGKGRAGLSGDESPGKAQETLENRAQRAQEGREGAVTTVRKTASAGRKYYTPFTRHNFQSR